MLIRNDWMFDRKKIIKFKFLKVKIIQIKSLKINLCIYIFFFSHRFFPLQIILFVACKTQYVNTSLDRKCQWQCSDYD